MAQGRKIYMDNCAACHKENGTGGKVTIEGKTINPDDLTSEKIKNFADDKIIGISLMVSRTKVCRPLRTS
jgi:cytochrome c